MFGYVVANIEDATSEEKARYHEVYCGLCRALGKCCGQHCRLTLNYDMVFLALLLESLYEPREAKGLARCATHPLKEHGYASSGVIEYAACVNVALAYHKCLDDWTDDRRIAGGVGAGALGGAYRRVQARLPRQCDAIERELFAIGEIERAGKHAQAAFSAADEAAQAFGRLMAELFVLDEDMWSNTLRALGFHLGRFIYLMDAVCDFEHDTKKGSYNPFAGGEFVPQHMETALSVVAGMAVQEFEKLPLEQDIHLLRNVLYSGIWQKYNVQFKSEESDWQSGKNGRRKTGAVGKPFVENERAKAVAPTTTGDTAAIAGELTAIGDAAGESKA